MQVTSSQQIAETILRQLGAHRFMAMTGSKHFIATGNGLRFSLARNASRANRCCITLEPMDTYSMVFYRQQLNKNNLSMKNVAKFDGLYADQLQDFFTHVTGLYTSMGTMGQQQAK